MVPVCFVDSVTQTTVTFAFAIGPAEWVSVSVTSRMLSLSVAPSTYNGAIGVLTGKTLSVPLNVISVPPVSAVKTLIFELERVSSTVPVVSVELNVISRRGASFPSAFLTTTPPSVSSSPSQIPKIPM